MSELPKEIIKPEYKYKYSQWVVPEPEGHRYAYPEENIAIRAVGDKVSDFYKKYDRKEPDSIINALDWSMNFGSVFDAHREESANTLRKFLMSKVGELRDKYNIKPGDMLEIISPQYAVPVQCNKSPKDKQEKDVLSSSSFETAIIFDKTESVVGKLAGFTYSSKLPDKYATEENPPAMVVCAILEQPSIITDSGEQVDGELGSTAVVPVSIGGDRANTDTDSAEFVLPLPDDFVLTA